MTRYNCIAPTTVNCQTLRSPFLRLIPFTLTIFTFIHEIYYLYLDVSSWIEMESAWYSKPSAFAFYEIGAQTAVWKGLKRNKHLTWCLTLRNPSVTLGMFISLWPGLKRKECFCFFLNNTSDVIRTTPE